MGELSTQPFKALHHASKEISKGFALLWSDNWLRKRREFDCLCRGDLFQLWRRLGSAVGTFC